MIYLIKRFDFDNLENAHSMALYETVEGYTTSYVKALEYIKRQVLSEDKYQGWDGQTYPYFKIDEIREIDNILTPSTTKEEYEESLELLK